MKIEELNYSELKKLQWDVQQELMLREIKQLDVWVAANQNKLSTIARNTIAALQEKLHSEIKFCRMIYVESTLFELRTTILRCSGEWIED